MTIAFFYRLFKIQTLKSEMMMMNIALAKRLHISLFLISHAYNNSPFQYIKNNI